jgi:simple sugar transport system ATP-binding protein
MTNVESTNEINNDVILKMENITKIYSNGFVANKGINLDLKKGEIHGLVGENGAGKTTLMKVLFGHETPEEGRILYEGKEVHITSPTHALELGIGMVHQHFMLVDTLSVAENMVLGAEPVKGIVFDKKKAIELTNETAAKYNLPVDPNALIKDLSVGYRQRVEILKVLLRGVKILILDEPTAVLTPQETEELFVQLINLKKQGFTIVFISHKLQEVKQICDRITVLRLGEVTGEANIEDVEIEDISRMMVGRDVMLEIEKKKATPGDVVLSVRDLEHIDRYGVKTLNGVSFDVREGEILGVAGVEGNGQSELSDTVCGLISLQKGSVTIDGKTIANKGIDKIRGMGVSMVHEDRSIYGASRDQSIEENLIADRYFEAPYSKNGVLNSKEIEENSKELIKEFVIKCDGPEALVRTLSGGNVQKVVAAREFSSSPRLLVASHPTRGIDVGATDLIRRRIVDLRDNSNSAVLLFSADLNELINVSDSIIVMFDGKITAYFKDLKGVTPSVLGEYMLGVKTMSDEEIGQVIFKKEGN